MFQFLEKLPVSNTQKGMILGLIGYTAFAFSDTAVKYLTTLGYSIYQIIFTNTGLAALVMLLCAPLLGGIHSLKDFQGLKFHGLRMVLNTMISVSIVYCFSIMPLASVYTAVFTLPFITAVLAIPLYSEKVPPVRWLIIGAGFAGILIAFQPWHEDFDLLLFSLPIGATVLIALMFLVVKSLKDSSPLAIGFYPVMGCCVLLSPLAISSFQAPEIHHFLFFLITGVFMSIGIICVSLAFRMTDSAAITPILYTEYIWAIIFGVLIFGDFPNAAMLIGAAIIIISGIFMIRYEKK